MSSTKKSIKIENRGPHPCLTNGESTFYLKEFILKPRQLDIARMTGTLQPHPGRNPILGEKSARQDYSDWNFRPPTTDDDDRLKTALYDSRLDSDSKPLIAQFQSQKTKFQEENENKAKYRAAMTAYYENKRTASQSKTMSSLQGSGIMNDEKQSENHKYHHQQQQQHDTNFPQVSSSRSYQQLMTNESSSVTEDSFHTQIESGRTNPFSTARSNLSTNNTAAVGLTDRRCATAINDFKVSSLKPLSRLNPDVVSNWRAQRAAQFIETVQQRDSIKMDKSLSSSDLQMRSYTPQLDSMDPQAMKSRLDKLDEELTKTTKMITKQQLLIGLNNKKYGPNKKNTVGSAMSRSAKKTLQTTVGVTGSARKYLVTGFP